MDINTIIKDAADTIREIDGFASIPVLEEDKGNVLAELDAKIAQQSLAVVVGWNGFTPRNGGPTSPEGSPFGSVTVVAVIYEKPIVNRTKGGSPTLLMLAQAIAKELDGAASAGMDDTLHLKKISPVSEIGDGVITCDVEFETKATL